jgi:tetratricopeptide (TPR) repeat protein
MFRKLFIVAVFAFLFPTLSFAQTIKDLFAKGISALQSNKQDDAIEAFESILKIKSDFAPAYNFLGMAYKNKGKTAQDVIPYFEKAIAFDPNYAMAYDNLGKAYYGMGDMKKALDYCRKAIQYDPDLLTAHLSLGWIYLLAQQQPRSAIKHFKKVVNANPLPYACLGLGIAYFQDNQLDLVLEMITYLRQQGEETYAKNLEEMVRQGRYIPPNVGMNLLEAPPPKAPVVRQVQPPTSLAPMPTATPNNLQDIKTMPVYLKAKMPGTEDFDHNSAKDVANEPASGTDRIRAMQQKGAEINW